MFNREAANLKDIGEMLERFLYIVNEKLGNDLSINAMKIDFLRNVRIKDDYLTRIEVYFRDHDDNELFRLFFRMGTNGLLSVTNENGDDYFAFKEETGLTDDMVYYIKTGKMKTSFS
jgi:hypothetical protein